ncbi:MAG: YdcF family protein [Roseibium sp.]|nr:YdcF family protein [Roseibium sp.]
MFFYLSKIIFFVVRPSNFLLLLLIGGLLLLFSNRSRRLGRDVIGLAVIALTVFGLGPGSNLLILPLEERFALPADPGAVNGILVLGGAVDTIVTSNRAHTALTTSGERVTVAAELARRFPGAKVIHTGGEGLLMSSGTTEADGVAPLLLSFGIDPGRIVLEEAARNTFENAVFTRDLIDPEPDQRWLLVTSAYHMPRAMGVFRAAGWRGVIAYPVDHRTRGWQDWKRGFSGMSEGLRRTDIAVREWIGLLAYRTTGRTNALFPSP